ncbi:uncharacterized protein LOC123520016 [Portunus trituberculatus]|uniref:uncharacterized protein LOC123520016 n=1 Tax=Portunus trituberculatus TaxID=210409 RepID=UPI001E1CD598|nr:uncharacterized protein LOC123520016 [Portunus trituberculatus]
MGRSYGYAPSHIVFRWPNWRARITEDSFSRRVIQEAPEHKHPASGGVARHSSQHMQQGSLYDSPPTVSGQWCAWGLATRWLRQVWWPGRWCCGRGLPHPSTVTTSITATV